MKRLFALILSMMAGVSAFAHPGHGHDGLPLVHYLASWWHVIPFVLAAALVFFLVKRHKKIKA